MKYLDVGCHGFRAAGTEPTLVTAEVGHVMVSHGHIVATFTTQVS